MNAKEARKLTVEHAYDSTLADNGVIAEIMYSIDLTARKGYATLQKAINNSLYPRHDKGKILKYFTRLGYEIKVVEESIGRSYYVIKW